MMIPDCQRRLEAAYTDLQQILVSKGFSCLRLNFFQTNTLRVKILNIYYLTRHILNSLPLYTSILMNYKCFEW